METTTVLQVGNVISRLVTTEKHVFDTLHKSLRFRPKNFWHNAAYVRKKWDGWKEFFDPKNGQFLTGLLPEVKRILDLKKANYELIDGRVAFNWQQESIDEHFLNTSLPDGFDELTLHDYQPDLANKCFRYNRGIVQAPTAAGKTFILISILKSLPPKTPTLFLTKNKGLVHQNYQEMKLWNVENLGRWYGPYKEANYITCATAHVDTFASLSKLLPKFKVLLVDEVHECVSDVPLRAYKKMKETVVRIGFSATPFKWDEKKINQVHKYTVKGHFGPVFKTSTTETGFLTTKDLQDRNILSKSNCTFYKVKKPELTYEPYQDAVKLGIEQNFHFHDMIAKLAKSRHGRTLIIVERIEQGEYLKQLIPDAFWLQGKNSLKEREPVINALKEDEKCIAIVMKQLITAGINVKIHDLINAAGGEGAHNVIQLMGRGLRTAKDKDILQYHDFLFMINDYLKEHSEWRMQVLAKEGHIVSIKESIDDAV